MPEKKLSDVDREIMLYKALSKPQALPDYLWLAVDPGSDGADSPWETYGGKQYVRLYEEPRDAKIPDGSLGRALLCKVITSAVMRGGCHFYRVEEKQWLSEKIEFPDSSAGSSWARRFADSKYVEYRVLLAEPEWFEGLKRICDRFGIKLPIASDSISGLKSVEYLHSKCKPPHNRPFFLVCRRGEDNYVFSDKDSFLYAHIVNPWDWLSGIDKPSWRGYKCFEPLLINHCFRDGSKVPLEYLPKAFYGLIRDTIPTMATERFMYAKEENFHGTVSLRAHYGTHNGVPHGIKAITIHVSIDEDDPNTLEQTLISGSQEDILAWLSEYEHRNEAVQSCRTLLQKYEASYDEEAVARRRKEQEERDREFKIRKGVLIKYNGPGGRVTVPDDVTKIGANAFIRCQSLTYVSLPPGVISIDSNAFYECQNLTGIHLPDSLEKIGWAAFYHCTSLTDIAFPSSLKEIGQRAFYKCHSLTSALLPDGIEEIEYGTFWDCPALIKVTLPKGLREIDMQAFEGCVNLRKITLPGTVTKINDSAFKNCPCLKIIAPKDSYAEEWLRKHGFSQSILGWTKSPPAK